MPNTTFEQFDKVMDGCRRIFMAKMHDYGTAWRILRTSSLTDQIYIKASRIRSIQEKGESKIDEGIQPEFTGIVNYSIMALIQLKLGSAEESHMDPHIAGNLFDTYSSEASSLTT